MHPRRLRCSSLKYSRYSRSSRLAGGAPRPSRCDARLSPRAVNRAGLPDRTHLTDLTNQAVRGLVLIGGGDERREQWMRTRRLRLEFRMELHREVPRMTG